MIQYKIKDKGRVIKINSKEVRTPCILEGNDLNGLPITFRNNSLSNYSIYYNPILLTKNSRGPLGAIKDPLDKRDYKLTKLYRKTNQKQTYNLPKSIDYTDEMSPVKDQGKLGSCVGFAIAAMKEWQERKEYLQKLKQEDYNYRRESEEYDLSEQWIYYKSKEIDQWPDQEGTSIRTALKQLQKLGTPPENGWEYNDQQKGEPEIWTKMISKWNKGGEYFRIKFDELEKCLVDHGPFPIGIICFEEIYNVGNNGIVQYPKNPNKQLGGHAVCLVGYDRDRKLFKFKNSWSTRWGKNGYGFLPYDYVKDFMMDAWVMKDIDVSKDVLKG